MSLGAKVALLTVLSVSLLGCAGAPVKKSAGERPAQEGCDCGADWKQGPPEARPLSDEEVAGEPDGVDDTQEGAAPDAP